MVTLGSRLDKFSQKAPGFDFVRNFLALSVLLTHCVQLYYGDKTRITGYAWWIFEYSILPAFFALSGFLVAGSALRNTLSEFIYNRFIRIVPALLVEIALSALVLGPLATSYGLFSYLSDIRFISYFANIAGYVHFELPGVFVDNPVPNIVNGSLWTIPHELLCYLVMSVLIMSGWLRRPMMIGVGLLGLFAVMLIFQLIVGKAGLLSIFGADAGLLLFAKAVGKLLPFFVLGVLAYLARQRIPFDGRAFAGCVAILIAIGVFVPFETGYSTAFLMGISPLIVYVTVYVGLCAMPVLPFYSRGDYSYGIYLYGYPLQQMALHSLQPNLGLTSFVILSIVLATLFAVFSWHVIEKPILGLKKKAARARAAACPDAAPEPMLAHTPKA